MNDVASATTSVGDPDQNPDPDPTDPHIFGPPGSGSISQRYGIRIRLLIRIRNLLSCKNSKKNLDSYYFVILFDFFIFEKWCKCTLKSNVQKNCVKISFLLASWRSLTKIAGSGSISQRHGSADPDPPQNVLDSQRWRQQSKTHEMQHKKICMT